MANDRDISAPNLSVAWIRALDAVGQMPKRKVTHLVVRIEDPSSEVPEIRAFADALLALGGVQRIGTVRTTIFPSTWSRRYREPSDLAAHYRRNYPAVRRFLKNREGTYFGRMVAYPISDGGQPFDQLTETVRKLRQSRGGRPLSSQYEINIWKPGDLPRGGMGFPCMSHLSFHREAGRLFLTAYYRNQYLVERAYGNYLGLAELQRYIGTAADLELGELMVVAGHAQVDQPRGVNFAAIKRVIEQAAPHLSEDGNG